MILLILNKIWWFLKRVVWFAVDNWKIVLPAVGILILSVWLMKACNRPPKLDENAIRKAQQAIAKQDREEMLEVLAESDTKEAEIDSTIKQIEIDREKAKKNYTGLTNDQLAEELERRTRGN